LGVDAVIAYSRELNQFYYIDLHKYNNVEEIHLRPLSLIKKYNKTVNVAEDFLLEKVFCNV
jgi:hypothetical protein